MCSNLCQQNGGEQQVSLLLVLHYVSVLVHAKYRRMGDKRKRSRVLQKGFVVWRTWAVINTWGEF